MKLATYLFLALVLVACSAFAQEQEVEMKITASDAANSASFGHAVSLCGDYAIVGAHGNDGDGQNSGAAYIFIRDEDDWVEQIKLTADDAAAGDYFGKSVSIDGNYAIVGAIGDEGSSGSAYIFEYDGENWTQHTKLTAEDAAANDHFGTSVYISGDYVIVGSYLDNNDTGSAYIFVRDGENWTQQEKLVADDATEGDHFGTSVSLDGVNAIIGADYNSDHGERSGSAYIFVREGDNWVQQAKLTADDAAEGDIFGMSVSISGDNVLIGAAGDDEDGEHSGSAYIFVREDDIWDQHQKLISNDAEEGDHFGYSVFLNENYAIIGSVFSDEDVGSTYIYVRDGENWTQLTKLTAFDAAANDYFGISTSLSGDYLVIGAMYNDDHGDASGSAYIYHIEEAIPDIALSSESLDFSATQIDQVEEFILTIFNDGDADLTISNITSDDNAFTTDFGGEFTITPGNSQDVTVTFSPGDFGAYSGALTITSDDPDEEMVEVDLTGFGMDEIKITAHDGQRWTNFGYAISINGNYAIVGAHANDDDGMNSGSAYIFNYNGQSWVEQVNLTASDPAAGDCFGSSAFIDGDYAVIGSPYDDDNGEDASGSVYIFKRNGDNWAQQAIITAGDAETGDHFGDSVAKSGDYVIVGACTSDDAGESSGSAYVFVRNGDTWTEQRKLVASDAEAADMFGRSVSISGDCVIVGSFDDDDDNGENSGSAYIFVREGDDWVEQQRLFPNDNAAGDRFGGSVCLSDNYAIIGAKNKSDVHENSGAAYIFVNEDGEWSEQAKLTASDAAADDRFGSVSISGNYAIVGAIGDNSLTGSAYIFGRNGETWSQLTKLTAYDAAANDYFGGNVSISGNRFITGAFYDDDQGDASGSAYIYTIADDNGIPNISVSPEFHDFGNVNPEGDPANQTITICNLGDEDLTIYDITTDNNSFYTNFGGQQVITPGNSIQVALTFDPDMWLEEYEGTLTITSDDPDEEIVTVDLSGFGVNETKILAGDADAGDLFGLSVSSSDNYAIIGAYMENDESGSAYIFVRDGSDWIQQAKLTAEDGEAGDRFGNSVALYGRYAIVGAYQDDDNGENSGSAYIFKRNGENWVYQAKLTADDGAAGDNFGIVSIDNDRAIVGAYNTGYEVGSAYIFIREGESWTQQEKVMANDAASESYFGGSVDLDGDYAIIGANADHYQNYGAAYIFFFNGENWTQQAKLTSNNPLISDRMGMSVSICGDWAIIGAPGNGRGRPGLAFLFSRDVDNWTLQQQLTASDAIGDDHFGRGVSINDGIVLVGAYNNNGDAGVNSGSAYIFNLVDGSWVEQAKLTADDAETGDQLGSSVSISSSFAIAGAYASDDAGESSGSAYIFQLAEHIEQLSWQMDISASAGNAVDDGNYIAAHFEATTGYDQDLDLPSLPPPPENFVSLHFPHPEWNLDHFTNFDADVINEYSYNDDAVVWEFEVETDIENQDVELIFTPDQNVPDLPIVLIDIENNGFQNLREDSSYVFNSGDGGTRCFNLVFADEYGPELAITYPNGGESLEVGDTTQVTWTLGDDPSGIDGSIVEYSVDNGQNYANIDTVQENASTTDWIIPAVLSEEVLIRVTAIDRIGNSTVDVSDSLFTIVDTTPPVVTVITPNCGEVYTAGDTVIVTWNASDLMGIDSSVVWLSTDGGSSWDDFETTYSDTFEIEFEAPDLYSPFCMINVTAYDGASNNGYDESDDFFIILQTTYSDTVRGGYNLISLPVDPADHAIGDVFSDIEDELIYAADYHQNRYRRVDEVFNERGYWVVINDDVDEEAYRVSGTMPYEAITVNLDLGWNLVGDPFNWDIPLDSVLFIYEQNALNLDAAIDSGLVQDLLHGYDNLNNSYRSSATFEPGYGYWFMALETDVQINIFPTLPDGGLEQMMPDDIDELEFENWMLTIEARSDGAADLTTTLGAHENATDGFDPRFDYFEPPASPGSSLSAMFEHDWEKPSNWFNRDIRSLLVIGEPVEWNLTVNSGDDTDITLCWPEIGLTTPEDYHFTLIDGDEHVDMLETESYSYESNGRHDFTIRVESSNTRELTVRLCEGWNMTSINVIPTQGFWIREEGPDVVLMMEQLRIDEDNHHVRLVKNGQGQFYSPEWDFNGIPFWNLAEGFQIKVDEDCAAHFRGTPIPFYTDIALTEGWNTIAYYPTWELDASSPDYRVLESIIDHVLIAKDGSGNFMVPGWDYSNMEPWRESQGYQVKVDRDVVLNYPEAEEDVAAIEDGQDYSNQDWHWVNPISTGRNMSVLVSLSGEITYGNYSQVAAFNSNGLLVGTGTIDNEGRCGLAVWGDDVSTDEKDGLYIDEDFTLHVWDTDQEVELELTPVNWASDECLSFEENGFLGFKARIEQPLPEAFNLSAVYPNPFNSNAKLTFALPEGLHVTIAVYDVTGRLVTSLVDEEHLAGSHTVVWNARDAVSGLYLIRMETENFSAVQKVMLMK